MSDLCRDRNCDYYQDGNCKDGNKPCPTAHNPEPDEAAESARTRLFSDRVPGQREFVTTEVQLAHS